MENSTSLDYQKIRFICEYIQFAISIVGIIGNFLAIIIFSRRSLSKYSYSFYSRVMAISDICLLSDFFIDWTGFSFGYHLETFGPLFCKIVQYIPYYFIGFSIYMLTLIAIDRMITIVYPRRFLLIKKRWFQSLMVAIVACIIVTVSIMIPLNYNLVDINQPNSTQTTLICVIPSEILNIQMWIFLISFIIVNILINNWLNIKTIRFIMTSRRRVINGNSSRNSSLSSRDRKFAICSVCLNISAMFLKLPFPLSLVILNYSNKSFDEIFTIIKITGSVSTIDNGFSFFVNMFVNSLFYNEFLKLFGIGKSNSTETNNNGTNSSLKTTR